MMKICMLVLNPFTHDTRVRKEAHSLAKAGFDVIVWALGAGDLPAYETIKGFQVKRLSVRTFDLRLRPPGLAYGEMVAKMTHRLFQEQAEVYHAHDALAILPCYLASHIRSAYLIYDAHEFWPRASGRHWWSSLRATTLKRLERFVSRRAQGVITVNGSIARELGSLYGIEPVVLMNCQTYVEPQKTEVLRRELNIAAEDRIAIYPGFFAPARGLEQLIASAPYLDRVVVVLMGRDGLDGKLQHLVQELGVGDRVRFREPVPPDLVPEYVASADIGVMPTQSTKPSYFYGSGNKLFHYIMAGIPAAVSDHPEKRRIVETYDVGAVFDETDPRNIAETINNLLNDRQRYQQMCHNAREAAYKELNWEVEERKLVRLYRSLQVLH